MLRLLLIVFCLVCTGYAEDLSWQSLEKKVYLVSNSYHKGKSRELLGAYTQAVAAYSSALEQSQALIQSPAVTKEQLTAVFPYMLASAYRLSMATEKMIDGRMVYLYEQIESYKNTDELISQTLTNISTMRIDHQLEIPVAAYAHLYYARALTSLGMAYTLAEGTLWKKYLVYMPSDMVRIVNNAESDLRRYLFLQGISVPTQNNTLAVQSFLESVVPQSTVAKTLELSYYTASENVLAEALTARVDKGVLVFSARLARDSKLFAEMSHCKTYEEFEKHPQTRDFVVEVKMLLEILKTIKVAIQVKDLLRTIIRPDEFVEDLTQIDLDALARRGIKVLLVDINNTIVARAESVPSMRVMHWFQQLKQYPFKVGLLTNEMNPQRAHAVAGSVGVDVFYSVLKPLPFAIRHIVEKDFQAALPQTAIIGDALVGDILVGNLLHTYTILVKKCDKNIDPHKVSMWGHAKAAILEKFIHHDV